MKITLFALNSSYTHTNLAIRYLVHSLEKAGFSPELKEFTLKDKKLFVLHELVKSSSDIYAFSVYIWNIKEMLYYAEELKKLVPSAFIIFGGPEVSFETENYFCKYPFIDCLISGEGETAIVDVCKAHFDYKRKIIKGRPSDNFTKHGILYDKYPACGDILYYESSRGCPHRCSYCLSSLSEKIRTKSVEQILTELMQFEELPAKPRIIKFVDRTFNYDLKRAKAVWKELSDAKYTLNYHFEIAADNLDEEAFEILSNIPKAKIQFEAGIQSTNPMTLDSVNRSTNSQKAISNLCRIKKMGNIHIHADLIAGLPYEDMRSFSKSFDETIRCCHKLQLGFLKMLKGSLLRNESSAHGYIYESNPPYTVLCNNYISFNDIFRLERIASVIDRFYSSDSFKYSMEYVIDNRPSAFGFFNTLTDMLEKDMSKTSQHECRMLLIDLLQDDPLAMGRLALDTLIKENKNPPVQLKQYYTEHLKDIINSITENFKGYNTNNLYVYTFNFDPDNYYIINRTEHSLYIVKK